MLIDGLIVKEIGLSRQLKLTMQGLVRDTQQCPVRHAETVALRRDGGAFHINGHRPRLVKAIGRLRIAQFPIAVVRGHHRAGAQPLLERLSGLAGDDLGGAVQGHLDLRNGRDRDFGAQHIVQNMIIAQIGVGQHIVADGLARAQTTAMADHQPCLRPQHGQMVGDGLGVGGSDADIDQGYAPASGGHQVIGRHLVLAPRTTRDRRLWIGGLSRDHNPACAG